LFGADIGMFASLKVIGRLAGPRWHGSRAHPERVGPTLVKQS
jgi:hypothetical protein